MGTMGTMGTGKARERTWSGDHGVSTFELRQTAEELTRFYLFSRLSAATMQNSAVRPSACRSSTITPRPLQNTPGQVRGSPLPEPSSESLSAFQQVITAKHEDWRLFSRNYEILKRFETPGRATFSLHVGPNTSRNAKSLGAWPKNKLAKTQFFRFMVPPSSKGSWNILQNPLLALGKLGYPNIGEHPSIFPFKTEKKHMSQVPSPSSM